MLISDESGSKIFDLGLVGSLLLVIGPGMVQSPLGLESFPQIPNFAIFYPSGQNIPFPIKVISVSTYHNLKLASLITKRIKGCLLILLIKSSTSHLAALKPNTSMSSFPECFSFLICLFTCCIQFTIVKRQIKSCLGMLLFVSFEIENSEKSHNNLFSGNESFPLKSF